MIRKNIAISQYFRIAETIAGKIRAREFEGGASLPKERELQDEFGVSRITIRKALDILAQEGFIRKQSGKASTIIYKEITPVAIATGDFKDWSLSALGTKGLQIEVMEIKVLPPPPNIRQALGLIKQGDSVWRMKRIKSVSGEPFSYHINFSSPAHFQNFTASDFQKASFVKVLQSIFNLGKMEQKVAATIADVHTSKILGIEFGDPIFYVENLYLSNKDEPIAFTYVYYRGDKYVYKATIPF